jgi:hypothetical protein
MTSLKYKYRDLRRKCEDYLERRACSRLESRGYVFNKRKVEVPRIEMSGPVVKFEEVASCCTADSRDRPGSGGVALIKMVKERLAHDIAAHVLHDMELETQRIHDNFTIRYIARIWIGKVKGYYGQNN